jgi:hypothetical protein
LTSSCELTGDRSRWCNAPTTVVDACVFISTLAEVARFLALVSVARSEKSILAARIVVDHGARANTVARGVVCASFGVGAVFCREVALLLTLVAVAGSPIPILAASIVVDHGARANAVARGVVRASLGVGAVLISEVTLLLTVPSVAGSPIPILAASIVVFLVTCALAAAVIIVAGNPRCAMCGRAIRRRAIG